jgi:hypothetical protein
MLILINLFGHGTVEELEKLYKLDKEAILTKYREEEKWTNNNY